MKILVTIILLSSFCSAAKAAIVVDFEELTTFTGASPVGGGQFYNGNDGTGTTNSNGWSSDGVFFNNSYNGLFLPTFDFWSGWSYSNVVNTSSAGFMNQYASYPGSGALDSSIYAIAFTGSDVTSSGAPLNASTLNLPSRSVVSSVDLANATYPALFAGQGRDGFPPEPDAVHLFGDGDFFRVSISGYEGLNGTGVLSGSLTVDLINFGGAGTADDFLQDDWRTIDLTSLGSVRSLAFSTSSSLFQSFDFGVTYSSDVPAYFALDNLTITAVPEPSSLAVLGILGTGAALWRKQLRIPKVRIQS